ncbi:MAG: ABC transporter substrate-binding protein [Planctomycetaceae bacterium]|jgi:iron complex transport system substrate-binding protein|nr:ABC transporter substrate-binding protein [Planctomycetaceae bacterium]
MRKILFFIFVTIIISGCGQFESVQDQSVQVASLELAPIRTLEQLDQYIQAGLVSDKIERIYCSGGTLRLVVYFGCAELVVATDGNERGSIERNGMKAYLAAHPELQLLPVAGASSGRDNPEALLALNTPPQLIIKADTGAGYDPDELTKRTGIPVLLIPMRGITVGREEFDYGLKLIGKALGKNNRADELINFFNSEINELKKRSQFIVTKNNTTTTATKKPTVYVGGVSYNGSYGFNSSESGYPPFDLVAAIDFLDKNKTDPILGNRHVLLAKEKIIEWNPDKLFVDLGTLALGQKNGITELKNDPAYQTLDAIKNDQVYTLLADTFYFVNHDAVLVNAWFVGKILYPEQFKDIDPKKKADEIFQFLVGKPVFNKLNKALQNLALEKISVKK